ncbi:hypothetical protein K9N68_26070 [Kovacikia minuta CCNUW1]|uniref:hypothetical protein n=1 Tax=Kovacikia minuta TaxID=2931930 RepID=UPI001CCA8D85|nr:hypothetical protein [Kovacikia minuta]UBF25071.1 hypothetical protein K9N68_26070 [Kovacikia minuta CCNUW1]
MPILDINKITCNNRKSTGGPIQLRVIVPNPPNQPPPWGEAKSFLTNEFVDFDALPSSQQPNPIPFINPIRVELWDDRYATKVDEIEIRPTNVGSSPASPPAQPTFTYFGGSYTLNYVVAANAAGLLLAYVVSAFTLVTTFLADFTRLTLETARSFLRLIIAPFRRSIGDRNNGTEAFSTDDSKPLDLDNGG